MTNELLLLGMLALTFGAVPACRRYFGESGLTAMAAVLTVLANIEVLILVRAFGLEQTLGNVLFAGTFLITDVLSETVSKQAARRAANVSIAASALFLVISQSWMLYVPSENDVYAPLLHQVFGNTPRVLLVSLLVYAVCQRLDVWLYHRIWDLTAKGGDRRRLLWLRNNGATLISQAVNCFAFNFLAFWGVYSLPTLVGISLAGFAVYVVTSLLDTPFLYWARRWAEKDGK